MWKALLNVFKFYWKHKEEINAGVVAGKKLVDKVKDKEEEKGDHE